LWTFGALLQRTGSCRIVNKTVTQELMGEDVNQWLNDEILNSARPVNDDDELKRNRNS
jgi:hypothetical protein